MDNILVIEDSKEYQKIIEVILAESHRLYFFEDARSIISRALETKADLILLDVAVHDGETFDAAQALQDSNLTKDIPILFVSGKKTTEDILKGLSLGADDYISKPFDPHEFRARVELRLNKAKALKRRDRILKAGNLVLNTVDRRAYVVKNESESEIDLLPSEFQLLTMLVQNCDRDIHRRDISAYLSKGKRLPVCTRSVDAHISAIRKRIPELGARIQAIYGVGYRFQTGGSATTDE